LYRADKNATIAKFVEVFETHGIEETSLNKLCDYGQINRNTVYQMFYNKEEIVTACGDYVTKLIETELRHGLLKHNGSSEELGEFFFEAFKEHKNKVRFCIQMMTSPNDSYNAVSKHCEKMIRSWSDEVAAALRYDKDFFEAKFRLFLSVMYHYCMTGDEDGTKIQCKMIYAIEQ